MTTQWAAFLIRHGGKDPGCGADTMYTCIESDAVHNACAACERCTLKAGYASMAARYQELTA
jgi:hypothetical protein